MRDKIIHHLKYSITALEILLGVIVGITVIIAIPDLLKYMVIIIKSPRDLSYQLFSDFLRHVLMLVVGLELMIMILTHSHESILTLVLFVIARKMLVYADGMLDIFIGALSIGLIFFVLKFFMSDNKMMAKFDNTFSAAIPVEKIRREYGYNLPPHFSNTLGGMIYELSKTEDITLDEGVVITYGRYKFTIASMTDGVIERVLIEEQKR
ncbi:MAG: transporter associated domain-containing protein [Tissierellia bacterium]|nr:transporter associated domain-containing protein [Tissierellia bacterium]